MFTVTKYTVVIIEKKPEFFVVRCGNCDGDGCEYCDYLGSVWVGDLR